MKSNNREYLDWTYDMAMHRLSDSELFGAWCYLTYVGRNINQEVITRDERLEISRQAGLFRQLYADDTDYANAAFELMDLWYKTRGAVDTTVKTEVRKTVRVSASLLWSILQESHTGWADPGAKVFVKVVIEGETYQLDCPAELWVEWVVSRDTASEKES